MRVTRRSSAAVLIGMALTGITSSTASADDSFGQHVAMCAHELGQRADAPAVTCTHDGMTMSFPNFGAMVQHMRQMH